MSSSVPVDLIKPSLLRLCLNLCEWDGLDTSLLTEVMAYVKMTA
jgi:hypothetical protein